MARKKKTTTKVQEEVQDFEVVEVTPAVEEQPKKLTSADAKEAYEKAKANIPAVKAEIRYESDKLEPTADVLMNTEIIVKTAKQIALEEFANFWNALPHHQYISDKEARYVHTLWQTATGRTDYYSNCSICTINHVKSLKKLCKNEGIEVKK